MLFILKLLPYYATIEEELKGGNTMPKISVSVPDEVLEFIDRQGKNRSKSIVTILKDYKKKKEESDLEKAYEEYAEFCRDDDKGWWQDFELASLADQERSYERK
ncbi:MAG: hypothetical protein AB2L14_00905 [Candidatus Xenobiia bacterium LiM19]